MNALNSIKCIKFYYKNIINKLTSFIYYIVLIFHFHKQTIRLTVSTQHITKKNESDKISDSFK